MNAVPHDTAPVYPADCWYVVLEGKELRPNKTLAATRFGLDLVFWRDEQGAPRCVSDRCPHRGASLSLGHVREGTIQCPFHGFRFNGEGACVEVPCNGPDKQRPAHLSTRAFVLREVEGLIFLWWGEARESYPPPPWFEILDTRNYAFARMPVDCQTSWTRGIENQLDWTHLPFVHHNTIGKSFPKRFEISSVIEGDRLRTWVKDHENEQGEPGLVLTLNFPNIWMNPFGRERVIGFAAFAPVDDTNSRLYFRTYVRRGWLPGLAKLIAAMTTLVNHWILGQDLRVIHSQPAECTARNRDEKLVQADLPIAQFRKELVRRATPNPPLVELRRPEHQAKLG